MTRTSVAPKPPTAKTVRPDRVSLHDVKARLRYSVEQLVPARRFATDLQELIDLVDYRARRPHTCPLDVWLDLKFRSRDLQDGLRKLTATLRVACAFLDVDTKRPPDFGDWIRRQLEILAIQRGHGQTLPDMGRRS